MNGDNFARDSALLLARLTTGASIAAHGAQKMFGAFGGPGPQKAGGFFGSLGFPDGERYARAAAATEMTSGGLIALGALGPVGPAMLLSVMAVAVETVHRPKGYFNEHGGFELNALYATVALLLATQGPGSFSIDGLTGLDRKLHAVHGWLALIGGVAGALAILSQRKPREQSVSTNGEATSPQAAPA